MRRTFFAESWVNKLSWNNSWLFSLVPLAYFACAFRVEWSPLTWVYAIYKYRLSKKILNFMDIYIYIYILYIYTYIYKVDNFLRQYALAQSVENEVCINCAKMKKIKFQYFWWIRKCSTIEISLISLILSPGWLWFMPKNVAKTRTKNFHVHLYAIVNQQYTFLAVVTNE
jgi:hypothetical protein